MRICVIRALLPVLVLTAGLRAGVRTFAPMAAPLTPRAALAAMWAVFENKPMAEVVGLYESTTDAEQKAAGEFAYEAVAEAKLQMAVRAKWGKDAEADVAHACGTDTRQDDDAAALTVDGDRAAFTFKTDVISPLYLVRVNRQWKIDMHAYVELLGADFEAAVRTTRPRADIINAAARDLADGKYADARRLADYLQTELDKIVPGP